MMKKATLILTIILILTLFTGCGATPGGITVATTTLPVYEFTSRLCEGSPIRVTRLITESVSCLHDYTLQVGQMRQIETAQAVIISGAGLEDFLSDALNDAKIIDASANIELICPDEGNDHEHEDDHHHADGHHHENDPHIWLSPANAKIMAENIRDSLSRLFPEHQKVFQSNCQMLLDDLEQLHSYAQTALADLSCRELITFHDGFAYLAQEYDLTILEAVEEESGSEASAAELIRLIRLTRDHKLSAVFTEVNGADSAANIIAAETCANIYQLDMVMAGNSYFEAMYHNIDTLKEALQ